jgi:hypothetical protein
MSATTVERPDPRTPEQRASERFAARRALAAASADVSFSENEALQRAASEALAARRRRDLANTPS